MLEIVSLASLKILNNQTSSMSEKCMGYDISHLSEGGKTWARKLEQKKIQEYKEIIKKIPNDIILHQAMQVLYDEYIYKNKKADYDDDFRDLLRNSEEMMHDLETLYHIEKAKRLEWV